MKTFVVLGMHNSATSLISGALHVRGVHMGNDMTGPDANQPHGYYENKEIVCLNKKILGKAGGNWRNPPAREKILKQKEHFRNRIEEVLEEAQKDIFGKPREHWGFKDPRTTLTVELYLPYLVNPHFVTIFRNPQQVAKSLKEKGQIESVEKGRELAFEYNERLINFLEDFTDEENISSNR